MSTSDFPECLTLYNAMSAFLNNESVVSSSSPWATPIDNVIGGIFPLGVDNSLFILLQISMKLKMNYLKKIPNLF